jgi:outer membrane lipoprotein-sorting protein
MLLALLVVFVSGCMEQKKEIVLNEPSNISGYEFEVFLNQSDNQTLANTTTYYLQDNKTRVEIVNLVINSSKLEIYPPESLGGSSKGDPIENFVLLVDPANETAVNPETFDELSRRNETSENVSYNLTQEISQNMKVINLEFEEPVTGFIAYTLETPGTQSFAFIKPDSEFIRVVLPSGYVTGNRVFGIARPEPFNVSFDEKGRQTLLWISSKMGEREEIIQVKYYSESAPLLFLAAIVALLFGVVLILSHYSKSKKELESVRGILDLEKEYEKYQKRKR